MIERIELSSDALGHTLDVWYGGDDGWRTIESKRYEFLLDVALALAERHELVQVKHREWRAPETPAEALREERQ